MKQILPVDGRRRIAVFIGTTPNIGTTLVAYTAAVAVARETGGRIGYLCLNLKSSKLHRYLGIDEAPASLDSLRADLKSRSLTKERLMQHCEKVPGADGLSLLFGSLLREQAEFFQPEDVEHLLCVAEEAFDLVIAEVNAYWDNAATVCAMEQASERFVVTTPDITHFQEDFQRWMRTSCSLLGIPLSACRLIVNGGDPGGGGGIRSKDIAKDMGVELVAELTRYPDVTRFINQGTLTEWATGQPLLRRQLDSVADHLMKMSGLAPAPAKARKTMKERMFPRISV